MKLAFKPEVRLIPANLEPWNARILRAALATAPAMQGDVVVVTSACDGQHMAGSLHYVGCAFDFRFAGMREGAVSVATSSDQRAIAAGWVSRLRWWLGPGYDVVVETDHIHVEYDPK
jgi:hypothetical protein